MASSLGNLTPDEFKTLSSEDSHRHLLVGIVTPSCKRCQDYYYPLVQALHAFRGIDVIPFHSLQGRSSWRLPTFRT